MTGSVAETVTETVGPRPWDRDRAVGPRPRPWDRDRGRGTETEAVGPRQRRSQSLSRFRLRSRLLPRSRLRSRLPPRSRLRPRYPRLELHEPGHQLRLPATARRPLHPGVLQPNPDHFIPTLQPKPRLPGRRGLRRGRLPLDRFGRPFPKSSPQEDLRCLRRTVIRAAASVQSSALRSRRLGAPLRSPPHARRAGGRTSSHPATIKRTRQTGVHRGDSSARHRPRGLESRGTPRLHATRSSDRGARARKPSTSVRPARRGAHRGRRRGGLRIDPTRASTPSAGPLPRRPA